MHRYSLILAVILGVASQVNASTWADGMFDELSHDFGSVPRGPTLTHYFRIANNTKNPVHIANVRVSCGRCSSARVLQNYLQPGQETAVLATMDTNQFINTKTITIYVTFDQPRFEEVRLWMQANSREDVVFAPASVAFGQVKRGTTPETKLTVSFLGGATTQILETKSDSNYVQPVIKEVKNNNGTVAYEITAKLRGDTPAGKWYTDIWLKTSNPSMPRLRVPVTVEVEAALSVNPSTVSLGQVKAGVEEDRKVIIRGVRPFRILNIGGTDTQLQVRQTSNESKAVHVLTVTLNPRDVGELSRIIRVQTDLTSNADIEFNAQAKVVP
jgi:hypothetical protein